MAYVSGAGGGTSSNPIYDALGNIRGSFASDGLTYKERTGQKPASERAQDTIEDLLGSGATVLDVLANNWKLILIAFVGLLIILKD